MTKFIGSRILDANHIQDNARTVLGQRVRLTYSQAAKLPPQSVQCSLDTTDRGSRGVFAKRWFRWFASPAAIMACPDATPNMRRRAGALPAQSERAALAQAIDQAEAA